ncbi:MAG: hypothetical protein L3J67_03790 [Hyphomicrobiaceae bacterium]|nr:hypothetical protein [Hyphomicrobiaceae bacterium]
MKLTKTSGAAVAAAAAAFIVAGAAAPVMAGDMGHGAAGKNVHCHGVNVCKGKTACKTAGNACKGQNGCKGKGFVAVSADACAAIGGKTDEKK